MQFNLFHYIALAVGVFMGVWIFLLKNDISKIDEELLKNKNKLKDTQIQSILFETSLLSQNKEIEELRVDAKEKQRKIDEWKLLPPTVRYEVIYKDVIKEQNLTGGCDELKSLINSTANINLNSL